MRTIGIRELKAHLSQTLRDVQRGTRYLVTDRGRVIAELRAPTADAGDLSEVDRATLRLAASGELRVAEGTGSKYGATGVHAKPGSSKSWLDWTRGE